MKYFSTVAMIALLAGSVSPVWAQDRGGILNFARYDGSKLIDPIYADRNPDIWMVLNLYDTLLTMKDGAATDNLTQSHEVSTDGLTLTLTLRDDIKFSDGSPMTGADVVFSLDRARNRDLTSWADLIASIDKVSADGNVVTVALKHPDPAILSMLSTFSTAIVSKAVFDAAPGANDQEKAAAIFASGKPGVGSGPFYLSGFSQGATMDFTANPNYWREGADGKPLPYLEGVHFEIIPDDATRVLKLQSGEVDVAELIPFSRVAELKADPNLKMELFPSTRIIYAPINTRETRADGSANPLNNVKLRQALNYATDKDALVGLVLQGAGAPMSSPLMSAQTPMAADMSPLYGYDIEKAKTLIEEAGIQPGTPLTFTTLAGSADDATVFAALQQMWAPLGINLTVEQVDSATRGAKNKSGEFDIHTYGWSDDVADPAQVVGWLGYNPTANAVGTAWDDATFNGLYETANAEMDPAKRADDYKQMQEIYAEAAPLLWLYQTPYAVATSTGVEGYVQLPLGVNKFDEATVKH